MEFEIKNLIWFEEENKFGDGRVWYFTGDEK